VIRFWADCDLIHLSAGGTRIKTLRSHLSPADLRRLAASGAVPAGPSPLPQHAADGRAVEVERPVSRGGLVSLGPRRLVAAEILGRQLAGIRIEPATLMFFDPATRVPLRTRPNPVTPAEVARLRGARPAGPPPHPSAEPVRAQRCASATGLIMVAGQKIAWAAATPGRSSPCLPPTPPSPSSSATEKPGPSAAPPPSRCVASRPAAADRCQQFLGHVLHISCRICVAHQSTNHTGRPRQT
jgi:hypothetical protein